MKTQSRELELGLSLLMFRRQLDTLPTGSRWRSNMRLKDQTARLFASAVSATYIDTGQRAEMGCRLTDKSLA